MAQNTSLPEDSFDLRFRGLGSPIVKRPRGYFQTQYSRDLIKSSILSILSTNKGERVFVPEYGSNLPKMLFEPNDSVTRNLIRQVVSEDVAIWEKRVSVKDVKVSYTDHNIRVFVEFQLVNTSIVDSVAILFSKLTFTASLSNA